MKLKQVLPAVIVIVLVVGIGVGWIMKPSAGVKKIGEGISIAFLCESSSTDLFWGPLSDLMEEVADAYGIEYTERYAEGDYARHADMMEEEIARGVDAIISPFWDPTIYNEAIIHAVNEGVVIVAGGFDVVGLPPEIYDKIGYVAEPSPFGYWCGLKLAEAGFEYVPNGGKILFPAEVPSASYILDGVEVIEEYFTEHGKTVTIEVLDCTNDQAIAESRIVSYITANPDIDAIMTTGVICIGASNLALEDLEIEPGTIPAFGQAYSDIEVRAIKSGNMPKGVRVDFDQWAFLAISNAFWSVYRGIDPLWIELPFVVVDNTNVDILVKLP